MVTVNLDHNATTPVDPRVAEALWPWVSEHHGNPSSASPEGRLARAAVERAREQVAALIGAHPDEVVFTSGGTESNNLATRGTAQRAEVHTVVTTAVEHPATAAPVAHLGEDHGWTVHTLGVDPDARARLDAFPTGPVGLGTMILAHNEVGTVQPVTAFAEAVHAAGGVVHADAAQAVGKIRVHVDESRGSSPWARPVNWRAPWSTTSRNGWGHCANCCGPGSTMQSPAWCA